MTAIAKEQRSLRARMDELNRNREKLAQERAALDRELALLEAERGKVEFALDVLSRVEDEAPSRGPRRATSTGRRVEGGSADFAIRALAELAGPRTAEEVVERMKVLGWAADAARPEEVARNALIRATATGEVRKVGRGRYEFVVDRAGVSAFGVDHGTAGAFLAPVDF
jgi:hypothetical protein